MRAPMKMDNASRCVWRAIGVRAVLVIAAAAAVAGCGASPQGNGQNTILSADSLGDNNLQFRGDRKPVLAPGTECSAFSPGVRTAASIPDGSRPSAMEPGHGCWVGGSGDDMVAVLTTATPFGDFWRRGYPDDDGSGLTAMVVDPSAAQLFERFVLERRYYAVRVGNQWRAGLDSGVTKTSCMLAVDTGSAQPLQITITQQVTAGSPAVKVVSELCALGAAVAAAVLDEQDPGGGSRAH